MVALYLASSSEGSGVTTLSAGIGRQLKSRNKKVGFFSPRLSGGRHGVEDAAVMRSVLGLEDPVESISPSFPDENVLRSNFKAAFEKAATGSDVVVIEGLPGNARLTSDLAGAASARVLGIETYSRGAGDVASFFGGMGRRLLGVVLNKVPRSRTAQGREEMSRLSQSGIKSLGIIPEDRFLLSLTVAELADEIGGSILAGVGNASAVVENIMLGAMTPDHGPEYYGHRANKAVITRSGRPDMQLAALDTSTRCVVLAGAEPPIQMVLRRAEEKSVPLITTKGDVPSVVAGLERALRGARYSREKAARAEEIVGQSLDLGYLFSELGI